jgi:hypothetical protein
MLSWNEIRHRAIGFSREWRDTTSEKSESQSFWNDFFHVFGIKRRTVASFEEPVKKLSGNWGKIDLFWPGKVLVEHKSAGLDLGKAHAQGMEYIRGLADSGREKEVPRWLIVSDFKRIALHDFEPDQDPDLPLLKRQAPSVVFPLEELHKHVRRFAFIPGHKQHKLDPEDPANIEAAELMAKLHDALLAGGFSGHDLRVLLVRLLFCLFADDTAIFNQKDFHLFIENRTKGDGGDTGPMLARLFEVLNTPENQRQSNLDEDLAAFPYINGELFAERIAFADFNAQMRGQLLKACAFKWERISPAVFGSLFQGVMEPTERRHIGAHYTAEKNILKLIRPLFLDELRAEFDAAKADKSTRRTARLEALHERIAKLRFLDPACGCGNFLVITYRELRALELEILLELHRNKLSETQHEFSFDVTKLSKVDVDQMHGIEIEEFPAKIAEVALWLADHQANLSLSETFGQLYRRIPLRKSPHIVCANALRVPWSSVLKPVECDFVLGNPPFVGKHYISSEQKEDLKRVWKNAPGTGVLDFVTGWYALAAEYILCPKPVRCAFVSTNSICQGEQASLLWSRLLGAGGCKIHFAHRTFSWESEARGRAHVHCVIVGFGIDEPSTSKRIYDYDNDPENPTITEVPNISPYLVEGIDRVITSRNRPLCKIPEMTNGSKPVDGGNLLLSNEDKVKLLAAEPSAVEFIRPLVGSEEFINGGSRWCLWLENAQPAQLRSMPTVLKRIEKVKEMRLASTKAATRKDAITPSLFAERRQPTSRYLAIPEVSSENRRYVPMAFLPPEIVCTNKIQYVPNACDFDFGVLTSQMHMAWMRQVCGRLKSDYSYSAKLVYNNFPWPQDATEAQRKKVEESAREILAAREQFPGSTLADLYDPVSMPPRLAKAHETLDRAVDRCYRKDPFLTDRQRVEYLFALYEQLTAPLAVEKKPRTNKLKGQLVVADSSSIPSCPCNP